jgi:UDP-N-acetylmuramoyl-tripeptide--D-alanyl-D-alanine ligase
MHRRVDGYADAQEGGCVCRDTRAASLLVLSGKVDVSGDVSVIRVKDGEQALGDIAAHWRKRFDIPCIAVTGSNGKSTTKEMTAAIVSSFGPVLKTEGNFNNLVGLPLTILRWRDEHKVAVLELGMNAPGEIARLTKIANPRVGIVTNVTAAHLEKLRTVDKVAAAKGEIVEAMDPHGTLVVNDEDPWVRAMGSRFAGNVISFGMQNTSTVKFGHMISEGLDSMDLTFSIGDEERTVHLPVPGSHNVMNALAAFAVGHALEIPIDTMIDNFTRFMPMAMRFENVQLTNGVRVVNDSYNANPQSMKAAFRTVSGAKRAGRFIAALGDMFELGDQAVQLHRDVGAAAAGAGVDELFLLGDHAKDVATGAARGGLGGERVHVAATMEDLVADITKTMRAGDVILIKGSRAMKMERLAEHLKREIGTG